MRIKLFIKTIVVSLSFVYLSAEVISLSSIYPLIICAISYLLLRDEREKRLSTRAAGVIFGIFAVLSMFQVNVYDVQLANMSRISMIAKMVVVYFGIYYASSSILDLAYNFIDNHKLDSKLKFSKSTVFLVSFFLLMVAFLPVWMMEYPSNISPDTISQINQILSGQYANHHPFAHTMWLKLLMSFSDDITTRIGIASFIQMTINAATFSYIISYIGEKTKSVLLTGFSLLFYALLSFNAFFSITLMKDVTHAIVTCLVIVVLLSYYEKPNLLKMTSLGMLIIGFCLFRSNGYYACFILFVVASFIGIYLRDYKVPIIVFCSLLVSGVIKGPIYHALGVGDASIVEMLSIPIQQVAFTIRCGGNITPKEYEMLNRIVDVSKVSDLYDYFLSDPEKNLLNDFGNLVFLKNNAIDYAKLWLSVGIRNPISYMRAWVNQVSLLFSPHYYSTSIFWTVHPNSFGVSGRCLFFSETLSENLHMLAYYQHNIPIIGWFHYQSFSTYILIMVAFYCIRKRDLEGIVVMSILLGILFTLCLSSPYNLCFRYYYSVVACMPLMLYLISRKMEI